MGNDIKKAVCILFLWNIISINYSKNIVADNLSLKQGKL